MLIELTERVHDPRLQAAMLREIERIDIALNDMLLTLHDAERGYLDGDR